VRIYGGGTFRSIANWSPALEIPRLSASFPDWRQPGGEVYEFSFSLPALHFGDTSRRCNGNDNRLARRLVAAPGDVTQGDQRIGFRVIPGGAAAGDVVGHDHEARAGSRLVF